MQIMLKISYISKLYNAKSVKKHEHSLWELVYCTRGSGTTVINDVHWNFSAGEMLVIPPMIEHSDTSTADYDNIHLTVTKLPMNIVMPFKIQDNQSKNILTVLNLIHVAYHNREDNYENLINSLHDVLFHYIFAFRDACADDFFVETLENKLIANISNPDFKIAVFMQSMPYNQEYLRRVFSKQLGMSPTKYLTDKRMRYAVSLLNIRDKSQQTIKQIAELCGFDNQLYFSKTFKKYYGINPEKFSRLNKNDFSEKS